MGALRGGGSGGGIGGSKGPAVLRAEFKFKNNKKWKKKNALA